MATIRAQQGDMVDAICRRAYGDESGFVEAVLDANPGLAGLGPVLPEGTQVFLPEAQPEPTQAPLVTLWD
ncbi:tail protein X [Sediminimonas qiaohouensis]|uniref:tail protein X n=1 Tax=Sediminimonas qiaohouensis TaxID=552061 RepID=UPI000423582C|nr:tail protein X [Sediminimonas qiaohouensis]